MLDVKLKLVLKLASAARIEQVARLQREVLADVGDDFIHLVEHIAGTADCERFI